MSEEKDLTMLTNDIFKREELEANENAVREQRHKELVNSFVSCMKSKDGRRVIAWLLELTEVNSSVTSLDLNLMLYNSARRDIGLAVLSMIDEHCPELKEQLKDVSECLKD